MNLSRRPGAIASLFALALLPALLSPVAAGAYVAATRKARGMANRESGNGLVGGFDAKTAWRQTLDTYLQCPRP